MDKIKIGKNIISLYVAGDSPRLSRRERMSARGVHTHFAYEVFFVTEGTLTVITEQGITEHRRSVVIIPPQVKHTTIPDSNGCYCLLFESLNVCFDGVTELLLSDEVAFYIKAFAKKEGEAREHLGALIFEEILSLAPAHQTETVPHISAIENYINGNLLKKTTLTDVAKVVHLSEKQVSRIINKQYGKSFCDVMTEKRMAKALMMLKTTDMKISDIARELCYSNENYFYTLFKKKYGMTPLAYKKSLSD